MAHCVVGCLVAHHCNWKVPSLVVLLRNVSGHLALHTVRTTPPRLLVEQEGRRRLRLLAHVEYPSWVALVLYVLVVHDHAFGAETRLLFLDLVVDLAVELAEELLQAAIDLLRDFQLDPVVHLRRVLLIY